MLLAAVSILARIARFTQRTVLCLVRILPSQDFFYPEFPQALFSIISARIVIYIQQSGFAILENLCGLTLARNHSSLTSRTTCFNNETPHGRAFNLRLGRGQ
jgi:hypothetical protein